MDKVGIIGAGRLGICLALNLDEKGYEVFAIDVNVERVDQINLKTLRSPEKGVSEQLKKAKKLKASRDLSDLKNYPIIFICVDTPTNSKSGYDHSNIDTVINELNKVEFEEDRIDLVIASTVMPGYCRQLGKTLLNTKFKLSYSPEFIAQGTIMYDQKNPDQILVGEHDEIAGNKIISIRNAIATNNPRINRMSKTEAEITKLAVNCFLTTKIAFANSIGDLVKTYSGDENTVLSAIASDGRIGDAFFKYGFGYGGPCLPRDNNALRKSGEDVGINLTISKATDEANKLHLQFQLNEELQNPEPHIFKSVAYKKESDILEESQSLEIALELAKRGRKVLIEEREVIISKLEKKFGNIFEYRMSSDE